MKFHTYDKIIVKNGDVLIGPILNRQKKQWNYYKIKLNENLITDNDPILRFNNMTYGEFKKINYSKIEYVELYDLLTINVDQNDIIKDLEFIQNEIKKIINMMNKYHNVDDIKYKYYYDLIHNDTHKIFGFECEDDFNIYVNDIKTLIDNKNEKYIKNIQQILNNAL